MAQDTGGLGGLLGSLFGGSGSGGGIGKVLQDLLGGPADNAQPAAGQKVGNPMPENPGGPMPQPGAPQAQQPPQGQAPRPQAPAGSPPGMPQKPQSMGQAAGGAAAGAAAGGGFGDLLDRLRGAGLGDQVDSWVGKGQNKPIDASQVTQALGPERVHDLAQHAGIPDKQVADGLAKALPQVVDTVTPQGKLPDPGALQGNIQRLLGS